MPMITSTDGTRLYYEEAGIGTPVVFVQEFAGDYRTWEPQMRAFSRSHRCVTFSARGYPPSEVPGDPARYGQDIARGDVVAIMDALGIGKAHAVGHSMGAYTALHVGIRHPERCISVTAAGCGWVGGGCGGARSHAKVVAENAKLFTDNDIKTAAAIYAEAPSRRTHKYKDPRGFAEFARMLGEHSALGHALTNVDAAGQTSDAVGHGGGSEAIFRAASGHRRRRGRYLHRGQHVLKLTVPTAGFLVIPRSGHNITSEEPAVMNAALADFFRRRRSGQLAVAQAAGMTHSRLSAVQVPEKLFGHGSLDDLGKQRAIAWQRPNSAVPSPFMREASNRSAASVEPNR